MAANIIERKYTPLYFGVELPFLQENARGKVTGFIRYEHEYYIGSGDNRTFTSEGDKISIQTGNWQDEGNIAIVAGCVVNIDFIYQGVYYGPEARTVIDVIGADFYIDTPLPSPYNYATYPSGGAQTGNGYMRISMNKAPSTVEFDFNLTPEANPVAESVIDGNKNTFRVDNVDTLAVSTPVPMVQVGQYFSGGHIEDVTLEIESVGGVRGISRFIKISYTFYQWGVIQDGYPNPQYFPLAPYQSINNYTKTGNLDGVQSALSPAVTGNIGGYDVNFAAGVNNNSLDSIQWYDFLGNQIDAPDYSNECTFEAIVSAPNQSTTLSNYMIGLTWRPVDTNRYYDKTNKLGEVLKWNFPDTIFQHSVTPDATVYAGMTDGTERFDLTDILFEVNAVTDKVTISGKLIPVNMVDFFESLTDPIPEGDRNVKLSISLSDHLLSASNSDKVELTLFDGDIIDAPTLGVQYPDIVSEVLLDHAGNDITANTTPNTTTNDDILYTSTLLLEKNVEYEGVLLQLFAQNDITQERFTLESNFFDFTDNANGFYLNGIHEWNKTIQRNFLLPISSDRNIISLNRETALDTLTHYGMKIDYGFISRIESWIANNNVAAYFYDQNLLNNGQNQNWARFTDGDWQLNVGTYIRKNDVDDFQIYRPKTRPFDDDADFTFLTPIITDANGTTYNGIPKDSQTPTVNVKIPVNYIVDFVGEYFTVQLRDFQGAAIGFISSVLVRDNIVVPNALKPVTGEDKLKTTIVGSSAMLEFDVNTDLINTNKVSLVVRAHTLTDDVSGFVQFEDETYVQFENGEYAQFE